MAKDDVVVTTTLMAPRHGTTGGKFYRINFVQKYHRNDSYRKTWRNLQNNRYDICEHDLSENLCFENLDFEILDLFFEHLCDKFIFDA